MSMLNAAMHNGSEILGRISFLTPIVIQVRYRTRPSLKEPTKFFAKQRLLATVKPIYPKIDVCGNLEKSGETKESIKDNKYALFLARRLRERFYQYPMIAVFHLNSFTGHDFLHARGLLYDNNFNMRLHYSRESRKVVMEALTGTKFEPVMPLVVSRTGIGFCADTNVAKLLQCLKKMPQYILIGLILEDRLLNRADIDAIAKLPDITAMRAQLCHTLQMSSVQLSQTLIANQRNLSSSLTSLSSQVDLKTEDTSM